MCNNYDIVYKMIIIGDDSVGKSNLLERYINDKFDNNYIYVSTIGVDVKSKISKLTINISDECNHKTKINLIYKLQIWDTSGHDRFASIVNNYYKSSNIIVVCFNTKFKNCKGSMYFVTRLLYNVVLHIQENKSCKIYILGTQIDCHYGQNINDLYKSDEFKKLIKQWKYIFGAKFLGVCSSKTNEFIPYDDVNDEFKTNTINDLFDLIARTYIDCDENPAIIKLKKTKSTSIISKLYADIISRPCCSLQ